MHVKLVVLDLPTHLVIVKYMLVGTFSCDKGITRRERLKSALNLRLKKRKVFFKYAQDVFMKSFENSIETKCAFHARYDWKITSRLGTKKIF